MSYCILFRDYEASKAVEKRLRECIRDDFDEVKPDIVIACGGDGTIIRAVHTYPNALIFGLNAGHLGYYCKYRLEDIDLLIDDINNKTYKEEEIPLLGTRLYNNDELLLDEISINEAVILSPLKALYLDVLIDDEYLESFKGNGLCFSTAYGSTGFNRSLRGSLVDRELNIIQMTEMAGVNSTAYNCLSSSLIISGRRKITLKPLYQTPFYISADNIQSEFNEATRMEIVYTNKHIRIAYHTEEGFIKRLNRAFIRD